jgi:hypothetical protein
MLARPGSRPASPPTAIPRTQARRTPIAPDRCGRLPHADRQSAPSQSPAAAGPRTHQNQPHSRSHTPHPPGANVAFANGRTPVQLSPSTPAALSPLTTRLTSPLPVVVSSSVSGTGVETLARRRGCREKPFEKTRSTLAEGHLRAAVQDALATDRLRAMDEMAVFGTHPYKRSSGIARCFPDSRVSRTLKEVSCRRHPL